ncbi:MAG: hypothetical protein J5511_04505 [Bacilli bacterium]|nr:hypothetical protein [Bacilli bacterium]
MKEPSVKDLKKYLQGMAKLPKAKYITSERLAHIIGIYPEVINENLSFFDPMIMMDYTFNLLELVPAIKKFIEDKENKRAPVPKPVVVKRNEVDLYESYFDFIYKKLTIGGMIDKSAELTDKDLKILKKLITEELANRKAKK